MTLLPHVKLKFEPRDLWVGVYWNYSPIHDHSDYYDYAVLEVYICVVPCLPLKLTWAWGSAWAKHHFDKRGD